MYDLIRAFKHVLSNEYELIPCFTHDVELSFYRDDFRTKSSLLKLVTHWAASSCFQCFLFLPGSKDVPDAYPTPARLA